MANENLKPVGDAVVHDPTPRSGYSTPGTAGRVRALLAATLFVVTACGGNENNSCDPVVNAFVPDDDDSAPDDDDSAPDDDDSAPDDDDSAPDDDDSAPDDDDSAPDDDDSAPDDDDAVGPVDADGDGIPDDVDQCLGLAISPEIDSNGDGVPDCAEADFFDQTEDGGPLSTTNPLTANALGSNPTWQSFAGPTGASAASNQLGIDFSITGPGTGTVNVLAFPASTNNGVGTGDPDYFNSFAIIDNPLNAFDPVTVVDAEGDTIAVALDPASLGSVEVCIATGTFTPVTNSGDAAFVAYDHVYEQQLSHTGTGGGAQWGTVFSSCQLASAGSSAIFEDGVDFTAGSTFTLEAQ